MHWVLTASEPLSLADIIAQSRWLLAPPFSVEHNPLLLHRVERLQSGNTVAITFAQASAGILIRTDERLTGAETEEISRKTWRMLRLGENLHPFIEIARHLDNLLPRAAGEPRLLRGATLFEDTVKAILTPPCAPQQHLHRIDWLVDQLGDPLPSNPTRHAFPTPRQLREGEAQVREHMPADLARHLIQVATAFTEHEALIYTLQPPSPLGFVERSLRHLLGLPDYAIGLMMLHLGHYDYIPTDACARRRFGHYLRQPQAADPDTVRHFFHRWHPWGGLIYWLWNWETPDTPTLSPATAQLEGGKQAWRA